MSWLVELAGSMIALASCGTPPSQPDLSIPIVIDSSDGTVYLQEGREVDRGALVRALTEHPRTGPLLEWYRPKAYAGALLGYVGVNSLLLVFLDEKHRVPILAGCLGAIAIGIPLVMSAERQLRSAVDAHNASLTGGVAGLPIDAVPPLATWQAEDRARPVVAVGVALTF